DREMAKPAQAEHRNDVARSSAAVAQGIERGDAGTHQGRRFDGRYTVGNERQCAGRSDHVLAIAAVEGYSRDLTRLAREEVPAPKNVATAAIAAMPTDPDALSRRPADDA